MDATIPPVPIANVQALLNVVGQWNLHDMEVREFRFRASSGAPAAAGPEFELTLVLDGEALRARVAGAPAVEHEFVFRFRGVDGLDLRGFGAQHCVVGYEFARDGGEGAPILVRLLGGPGGDAEFLCAAIEVVSVSEREIPGAA